MLDFSIKVLGEKPLSKSQAFSEKIFLADLGDYADFKIYINKKELKVINQKFITNIIKV